jgi:hypothetical protein
VKIREGTKRKLGHFTAVAPWLLEALFMTWNMHRSRRPARKSFLPSCETLEDRNLLSSFDIASLTSRILPILNSALPSDPTMPPIGLPPGVPMLPPIGDPSESPVTVSKEMLQVSPGGASDSYTLVLNSQPTADVTITVSQGDTAICALMTLGDPTGSGSAPSGPAASTPLVITPTTLTFTSANWNMPQTVTVSAPANADSSTPIVVLSHSISSTDPNFNTAFVPDVFVQVGDLTPPTPPPVQTGGVDVSTTMLQLTPGGPAQTYNLVLTSQPTANVTITVNQGDPNLHELGGLTLLPGNVGEAVQVTVSPTTLTFTPADWNMAQTISVSPPASLAAGESPFTFLSHTVTSDDPNYNDLFVPNVFVHVGDVTPPTPPPVQTGGVDVSTHHLEVTPGGPAQTYTVVLTSQPTSDVTITIAQQNIAVDPPGPIGVSLPTTASLVVTPTTLTFTTANWNQPQTVTVSLPADASSGVPFTVLTQTVTSDDPNYSGLEAPNVFVHIAAAAQPGLVLSTHHLDVTAGDTTGATYTVALATKPTANVTVTVQDSDTLLSHALGGNLPPGTSLGSLTITPQTLTFTPDNWNMAQSITVTAPTPTTGSFSLPFAVLFNTLQSDDPNYNNIFTPPVFVEIHGLTPPNPGTISVPPVIVPPISMPPVIGLPIAVPPIAIQPPPTPQFLPLPPVPAKVQGLHPANTDNQAQHTAGNHKKIVNSGHALIRRLRRGRRSNNGLST